VAHCEAGQATVQDFAQGWKISLPRQLIIKCGV